MKPDPLPIRLLFTLFFSGLFAFSSAQTQTHLEIDSLQSLLFQSENDSVQARYLASIGHRYRHLNDWPKAMEYYQQELDLCLSTGHKWGEADAYNNIHSIYLAQRDFPKAGENLRKSLHLFEKLDDSLQMAKSYNNLGVLYLYQSEFDSALFWDEKALQIKKQYPDTIAIFNSMSAIARVYKHRGDDAEALKRFRELLVLRRDYGDTEGEISTLMAIGGIYVNMEEYAKAVEWILPAVDLANRNGFYSLELECYGGLSQFYAAQGDFQNAWQYSNKFHALQDSLNSVESQQQLNRLMVQFDTEKKERELAESRLEKAEKDVELAEKNFLLRALFLGLIILFLLAGTVAWVLIQRNRMQRERAANKEAHLRQEMQVNALNSLLKGQEDERNRIARDLHDGLGGMLAALKLQLGKKSGDDPESLKMVDEVSGEVRRIAHNMVPAVLRSFGLKAALESLAEKLNQPPKLVVHCQTFGLPEGPGPNPERELAVYRIVQELSTNTLKHARASELFLQVNQTAENLNIMVEDNGKGFSPDRISSPGLGLGSVRNRVQYLGGEIHIDSRPDEGTSVMIDIPRT